MLSAGDLGIEIDFGVGNPLETLQRFENGDWQDYRPEDEAITSKTLDIESLIPGKYRVIRNDT
jgi:hypothetical protein